MGTLSRAGALRFVESGTKEAVGFFLWLHDYAPAYRQHVNDLLALLNVEAATSDEDIFLEVVSRLHTRGARTVSIETRSVYDLGQIGAAAVDVPEADRLARLTTEYPKPGLAGGKITIRRARLRASWAPVPVEFDFVKPFLALRDVLNGECIHRLNEFDGSDVSSSCFHLKLV